jgi:hypothetical protein
MISGLYHDLPDEDLRVQLQDLRDRWRKSAGRSFAVAEALERQIAACQAEIARRQRIKETQDAG